MEKYSQAHNATLKLKGLPYDDPPPAQDVIDFRLKAIAAYYARKPGIDFYSYLCALGYARAKFIAARAVLKADGKKKYELAIKAALSEFDGQFAALDDHRRDFVRGLLDIPFRRSAAKDDEELRLTLWYTAGCIVKYRRHPDSERIKEYMATVARSVGYDALPPAISSMIIAEVTELVTHSVNADVLAFVGTGLTCSEFLQVDDPADSEGQYPDSPDLDWPVESIAEQCLWWGFNETVDDFISSLAGGLLHLKHPSKDTISTIYL